MAQQHPNPIRHVRTLTVNPPPQSPAIPRRVEMSPWDIALFNSHYIQKGHLFSLPSLDDALADSILASLASSLSLALLRFYPLAGRLANIRHPDGTLSVQFDCANQGAELSYAVADDVAVSDVLGHPHGDLPPGFIRQLFPCDGAISYDGHDLPLLSVQVTRLADGIFLGYAYNHAVSDGSSLWHFLNSWAAICRGSKVPPPPRHGRWFPDGAVAPIKLPYSSPDEFIERLEMPPVGERMFHFSAAAVAALKAQANRECNSGSTISSFQALSALLWRTITRLRGLRGQQKTTCRLAIENRSRLRPQIHPDYFGNCFYAVAATTTAEELLEHDLGWAAMRVHRAIAAYDDEAIRRIVRAWMERPAVLRHRSMADESTVLIGSSPRFDVYGCDFGWGRPVAVRGGAGNKSDGKVSAYPGREGGGSVDLEVSLLPEHMKHLGLDEEFMAVVSGAA